MTSQLSRYLARIAVLLCFLPLVLCSAFAQYCADEGAIKARLDAQSKKERHIFIGELEKAQFFGSVLRWTAVAGRSMIPTLLAMSRPGMSFNSIPGEAQISLAKLGDENALSELEKELHTSPGGGYAVEKLLHVATNRGYALLMAFLKVHISDSLLTHEYGDYNDDVRWHIIGGLSSFAAGLPNDVDPAHPFDSWLAWWEQRKGDVVLSISGRVDNPYLACLARKVEWGFPDAIFDMGNSGNTQAISLLKSLERVGAPVYTLNSVRGRAQFALAKLGDEDSLASIGRAVSDYGASADIDMLWKIGGPAAVDILLRALDSTFPRQTHGASIPPDPKDKKNFAAYEKIAAEYKQSTDSAILNTLSAMVADPPPLSGGLDSRKEQWRDWWRKNRTTAQFTRQRIRAYE